MQAKDWKDHFHAEENVSIFFCKDKYVGPKAETNKMENILDAMKD